MQPNSLVKIIEDQTVRALWEVQNVIDCIPDNLWHRRYCGVPLWKHVYHTLHSLDLWFINPRDETFQEPSIHSINLNNLDVISDRSLSREEINSYFSQIEEKIKIYLASLRDEMLLVAPVGCEYARFTLILAQHRHLHSHMGMLMGFIIQDTGRWPRVVGLEGKIPEGTYEKYV